MKKTLLALALAVSAFTADAASYRGFFDLFGGVCTGGKTTVNAGDVYVSNIKSDLAFGLNMTHGCQITPFLYAGAGFGAFATLMSAYELYGSYDEKTIYVQYMDIPLFIDVRYDLNIRKKVTPFVDLKLGYRFSVNFNNSWDSYRYTYTNSNSLDSNLSVNTQGESGFYFQPSIGLRFRMGKKSGFNLGVAYNTSVNRKLTGEYRVTKNNFGSVETLANDNIELKKLKEGAIMLHLGFDF